MTEKSALSDKIKKHLEELESQSEPRNPSQSELRNQSSQVQPANMLNNKRVLPSRLIKSRKILIL